MAKEKWAKRIALSALALISMSSPLAAQSLANGKVTTAAPTYVTGTANALSLDTSGNLRVSVAGGGIAADVNVDEIGGVAVVSTTPGTFDVTCISGCGGSGGTSSAFGAAFPTDGTAIGFSNGVNMVAGTVNGAGDIEVVLPTALPAGTNNIGDVDVLTLPALPAGNNNIGDVDAIQSGTWNIGTVSTVTAVTAISNALPAGNNNIGDVDVASIAAGNNNIGDVDVASIVFSDQGTSNFSLIAANSTNSTNVKASAGTLYEISVYNNSSTIAYLKLYNSASAPTCGSGTPVGRYLVPGASAGGAGSNVVIPLGKTFGTGIGFCLTTGIADADTGAVAATTYLVNLTYR